MRILVISDSHGDYYSVQRALREQPSAKLVFFLGDGEYDIQQVEEGFHNAYIHKVKGNCDFGSILPAHVVDEVNGVRIYATHGYVEKVKFGKELLLKYARDNNAAIALYGHTHVADTTFSDGVWLINPGSIRVGEYAVVDIETNGIMPILMKLKN